MKKWQVLPKIEDKFLRMYPTYDRLVLQLLKNRKLTEKAKIDRFLEPDLKRDGRGARTTWERKEKRGTQTIMRS